MADYSQIGPAMGSTNRGRKAIMNTNVRGLAMENTPPSRNVCRPDIPPTTASTA